MMLPELDPQQRAAVWGMVGGIPLYLEWWDQRQSVRENLAQLVCTPGGRLLNEGAFILATEGDLGDLGRQILYAIAAGRTKHHEIADAVGTDPSRTIERLIELRLVERISPVTEDPRRTRRRLYRIADNFLAFWLSLVDRYRAEIERRLGGRILDVMLRDLDDHLGAPWEEAFRVHLRRLAISGELPEDIVAIGPYWTSGPDPHEIDAVALAGRDRSAVLVGEAKWTKQVDGSRLRRDLERKVEGLPSTRPDLRFCVCGREQVINAQDLLAITAADIFS